MTVAQMTHPDDLDADAKQFERMLAGEIDNYVLDKRFIRKDGEIVYTNLTVACIRAETGDVSNVLASFQDITERKKMDDALNERIKELDEAQSAMLNMMEDLDEEKAKAEAEAKEKAEAEAKAKEEAKAERSRRSGGSRRQGVGEAFIKSTMRSVGRSLGTRLVRGARSGASSASHAVGRAVRVMA